MRLYYACPTSECINKYLSRSQSFSFLREAFLNAMIIIPVISTLVHSARICAFTIISFLVS